MFREGGASWEGGGLRTRGRPGPVFGGAGASGEEGIPGSRMSLPGPCHQLPSVTQQTGTVEGVWEWGHKGVWVCRMQKCVHMCVGVCTLACVQVWAMAMCAACLDMDLRVRAGECRCRAVYVYVELWVCGCICAEVSV